MQEQRIHYHIKSLRRAGALTIFKEEQVKGGIARYYRPSAPAFAAVLPFGEEAFPTGNSHGPPEPLASFLSPFLVNGSLSAKIVVGSPMPHGPFKATARDGHYATYFGLFLGQFAKPPEGFCVKLDTDVKAEKEEGENLIIIGGPGTNLIASEVNRILPIRFSEENFWHWIESEKTGNHYNRDSAGIIARIPNPLDENHSVMVLAGLRAIGTKSCVIGFCTQWKEILRGFRGQERWATVIQGYDFDGDGKVDGVEVLETISN